MAPIRFSLFDRLQTRLTVLYASLFAAALLGVSLAVVGAVSSSAERAVRAELTAGGTVFDRLWALRSQQLMDGAGLLARDFGFRAAFATGDERTIGSALINLKNRLGGDLAYVVDIDGRVVAVGGAPGKDQAAAGRRIADALVSGERTGGIITIDGVPYQAVSTPILSPALVGWVVFGVRLDQREMDALQSLSAIPLNASVFVREDGAWRTQQPASAVDRARIDRFLEGRGAGGQTTGEVALASGEAIALAKSLPMIDGRDDAVLVLHYGKREALAPYRALMAQMIAVGLLGLMLLVAGSWALARRLTRPITALDDAARRLQTGEDVEVVAETGDEVGRLAESFNRMAQEIRARERRITHLALHDADTDLPNRAALERAVAEADAADGVIVIVAMAIERFTQVRGAIGYGLAAQMVGELGRLLAAAEPRAKVGRLSSDSLGAVIVLADARDVLATAARMRAVLERPIAVGDATVDVSLTAGVALHGVHGDGAAQLIDRASIAVDQARGTGACEAVFDPALYGDPSCNLSLMSEMIAALKSGAIEVHYQPKLDLRRQGVTGVEALVRWTHPTRGRLAPDLFVGMAEETGHIRALTEFVLERALADQRRMKQAGYEIAVAVNISGRLIGDAAFGEHALAAVRGRAGKVYFEITETVVIQNEHTAFALLDALAAEGVEVSIDDYGSGLSSLAYLKRLRAGELKIDRQFVTGMGENGRDALLVKSTIDLAHSLGLQVTAEGVEDDKVIALLSMMGCDLAQGYGVARPMPLDDLLQFLQDAAPATTRESRKAAS
jgi:EAL domain-containing protein (putative c-di-GMP-specific phosphodiesterase class I)/GGDEF domain-containing protein